MRIGELAERAGVSTRALRYYEQQGLLPARRGANGYRHYEESDLRLVAEIRSLLAAGFTLEDARPFVDCLRAGHPAGDACPESVAVYRRRLAEIDAEIRTLIRRRAEVAEQLTRACPGCVLPAGMRTGPRTGPPAEPTAKPNEKPTRKSTAKPVEDDDDHADRRELRRAGAPRRRARTGRLLGGVVPSLQDDRTGPGGD